MPTAPQQTPRLPMTNRYKTPKTDDLIRRRAGEGVSHDLILTFARKVGYTKADAEELIREGSNGGAQKNRPDAVPNEMIFSGFERRRQDTPLRRAASALSDVPRAAYYAAVAAAAAFRRYFNR